MKPLLDSPALYSYFFHARPYLLGSRLLWGENSALLSEFNLSETPESVTVITKC